MTALLCCHFRLMPEEIDTWDDDKFWQMYYMLQFYLEKTASVKFG